VVASCGAGEVLASMVCARVLGTGSQYKIEGGGNSLNGRHGADWALDDFSDLGFGI
jgi:hypothetical protein